MSSKREQAWDNLQRILKSKPGIKEGWNKVIDFHSKKIKKTYWSKLKRLNVEGEQDEIKTWLESLVTGEPPKKDIIAFWIGINKFIDDDDEEFCGIYAAGSKYYDKKDADWASRLSYWPKNRYFRSDVLDALDAIIMKDRENYLVLDWILPLAYTSLTMNDLIANNLDKSKFLKHQNTVHVTAGHDNGDWVTLKPLRTRKVRTGKAKTSR